MSKTPKIGSLVYVEWEDSYGCSDRWEDIPENHEPDVMICKSVGWLTASGKRSLVIVPHLGSHDKHGCGDMAIPIAAIVKIRKLNGPARKAG